MRFARLHRCQAGIMPALRSTPAPVVFAAPRARNLRTSRPRCKLRMRAAPSSAEVARTITSLVTYGTLSTMMSDGMPLGTFVTFVLDSDGLPLLRLRADATHTANLKANKKCTLFVHAAEKPLRELARLALLGQVEQVTDAEASKAAEEFSRLYGDAVGVDALREDDIYMRLRLTECFYVSGIEESGAETLTAAEYTAAQPDELKGEAANLVQLYNSERMEDVLRIAASRLGVQFEQMYTAEFVWIDSLGVFFRGQTLDGASRVDRFDFDRAALDERDAISLLTMAAQYAWEQERDYAPVMPDVPTVVES